MKRNLFRAGGLLMVLLFMGGPVRADVVVARALNKQAMELFKKKQFKKAIFLLNRAMKEFPTAKIHFNLGNCYLGMKLYRKAVKSYEIFLKKVVMGEELRKRVNHSLDQARAEFLKRTVRLLVKTRPPGAMVMIGDQEIKGKTALKDRIKPGSHFIKVVRPGYKPVRMKFMVPEGAPFILNINLQPLVVTGQLIVKTNVPGAAIWVAGRQVGVTPLKAPLKLKPGRLEVKAELKGYKTRTQRATVVAGGSSQTYIALEKLPVKLKIPIIVKPVVTRERYKIWKWVTLGVGIAAALAGTVHAVLAWKSSSRLSDYTQFESPNHMNLVANNGKTNQILSIVEFGISAAALGTSIALFVLGRKKTVKPSATGFGIQAAPFKLTYGFRF